MTAPPGPDAGSPAHHSTPDPEVVRSINNERGDRTSGPDRVYGPRPVAARRQRRTRAELATLDEAITEAVEQDAPVSLRGVYYRVVSTGLIPKTENSYKTIGRRLLRLRRTGQIDYGDIADGTRWVIKPDSFDSWEQAARAAAEGYRQALWTRSPHDVRVFVEKDAISGVIYPICDDWDVALGVLRGYCSETFAYSVADSLRDDRRTVIAQLGDHDPSGVGAWEDFILKVIGFRPGLDIEFVRLAVTTEQVEEWHLPTRPTKGSDPRAAAWEGGSVEVDAIPANDLRALMDDFLASFHDPHEIAVLKAVEEDERTLLRVITGMGQSS